MTHNTEELYQYLTPSVLAQIYVDLGASSDPHSLSYQERSKVMRAGFLEVGKDMFLDLINEYAKAQR